MSDPGSLRRNQACRSLADAIAALFSRGLPLHEKAARYIEAVLFPADLPCGLCAALTDPRHPERESLMELVFFPDEAARISLEPILEEAGFKINDEQQVLSFLMESRPRALLIFPDHQISQEFPVAPDAAARYLKRLNLTVRLDPGIVKALGQALSSLVEAPLPHPSAVLRGHRIKSMIRHCRAAQTRFGIDALCTFFRRFPVDAPDFFACLSFFLDFLETPGDESDLATALLNRQRLYRLGLDKGAIAQGKLTRNNPETRILSGTRLPHVDARALMEKIDLVDRICCRLFEGTPTGGAASSEAPCLR